MIFCFSFFSIVHSPEMSSQLKEDTPPLTPFVVASLACRPTKTDDKGDFLLPSRFRDIPNWNIISLAELYLCTDVV